VNLNTRWPQALNAAAIMINMFDLLALDSSYAWENLTLDGLQQSTTTSRDVRYLIGQTELVDTSHRVATTNQRECTVLGSLSDSIADST
jgi:hypothetical protein